MKANQMFDMAGQAGIVTGGASGIGLAMAEVIAEHGCAVTIMDMNEEALERAVARLRGEGRAVEGAVVDVTQFDRLEAAIGAVATRHGRLDVCFANAGSGGGAGSFTPEGGIEAMSLEAYRRVIAINQNGAFATAKFAAQHMIPRRYGRIVLTASVAGLFAEGASYSYGMSKAAIAHLVAPLARQLGPHNVLVNAIAPGPFITNIGGGYLHENPEAIERFARIVPLNRMAETEEMKGLALLLASPASSFITGSVIMIDGGTSQMRLF
ncbi:MAG TPA: SDR family NAD(P)-dependent oxidoreductase [Stellaceae bacterium]|nr:SDR family NAD(P)-dependent oxidoreductase [Stellaceae bacterium]